MFTRAIFFAAALGLGMGACPLIAGTIVELDTPIGDMTFELYDDAKPITVANFLNYITSGAYADTFAHRLVPGFVLQGGGYGVDSSNDLFQVSTSPAITNEAGPFPAYSNVLGTLSMAKLSDDPDSATSQWFINLGDNSSNLDTQNGGFTVFGAIISGMDVLQEFNAFTNYANTAASDVIVNASGVTPDFSTLPVSEMDGTSSIHLSDLIYTNWSVVPEPSSVAFLAVGAAIAGAGAWRKRRRGVILRQ